MSKLRWPQTRLRFAASINPSRSAASTLPSDTEVSFVPMDAVGDDGSIRLDQTCRVSDVGQGYTFFAEGDVIIAKITPCFENGKGALAKGLRNGVAFGTTELVVVRPNPGDSWGPYLQWLFTSPDFRLQAAAAMYGAGGQKRVPDDSVRNFVVALPSIVEQQAIAAFLDRETTKIDALVAEQERLLALLAEKRQAVISRAVTQGLDPSVPMKDSGVEWMGPVPAHWEVRRVKSVITFTTSGPRGWSERVGDDGSLFIQSGDLNDRMEVAFDTTNRVQVEDDAESRRTCLRTGDVVVCITGARTGNVAVCEDVPEPAHVNQHLCIIRLSPKTLPAFIGHTLKEGFGRIHFYLSQYGLKQGLSLDDVRRTPLAVPPVEEQEAITTFIKGQARRFDMLTVEAGHTIRLLKERRAALISAAVTGKLDVRGLVPTAEPAREAA